MSSKPAYLHSMATIDDQQAHVPSRSEANLANGQRSFFSSAGIARYSAGFLMVGRYAAGLAAILAITELYRIGPAANATTVGFTYLLAILVASTLLEFRVVVFMSISAMLLYDYFFLPPVGTLNIADPQDWVALFSFLATALIGSRLSTRIRQRAQEADRQRNEVERLYDFSQRLLSAGNSQKLFDSIPRHIVESFKTGPVALYLSEERKVSHSGAEPGESDLHRLMEVVNGNQEVEVHQGTCFVPLRLGTCVVGGLAISSPVPSMKMLEAIGTQVAVAIDRTMAVEHVAEIEATRERERLKSVFLDAITHDFRTPLTSIKVSATGLLDDLEFDREQRKELLTIIDEECDRINELVGEACEMARLESGEIHLNKASHPLGALITMTLADCKGIPRERPIHLDVKDRDSLLLVDLPLAKKALHHLIANAHLYSTPGQPIMVSSEERNGFHFISVADGGPGIEEKECARIFEKFYRGKDQRLRIHGTGMGLPIAKTIVEAHGGTMSVSSRLGHGSVFTISLPVYRTPLQPER